MQQRAHNPYFQRVLLWVQLCASRLWFWVNGAAKGIAFKIAGDLESQGYFVDVAGIESMTAKGNASQYQAVMVGGPIENGKASNVVQSYLSNLVIQGNGTVLRRFRSWQLQCTKWSNCAITKRQQFNHQRSSWNKPQTKHFSTKPRIHKPSTKLEYVHNRPTWQRSKYFKCLQSGYGISR